MSNWNTPSLGDLYTSFLSFLKGRDEDCAKMFDGTGSNLPIGTKRWNEGAKRFEKQVALNSWVPLATLYQLNVSNLDGKQASDFVTTTQYNATDVLNKLKTVDSDDSGINATTINGATREMLTGRVQGTTTQDPNTTLFENILTSHANNPTSDYYYVTTVWYGAITTASNRMQTATEYTQGQQSYKRVFLSGTWKPWVRVDNDASELLNKIKTVDGATSGLDAQFLSGMSALEVQHNTHTQLLAPVNLPIGWYTIATAAAGRNTARFSLTDTASNQAFVFYATHIFGADVSNNINILSSSRVGGTPLRHLRIKDHGTFDGASLQVYIEGTTNRCKVVLLGDIVQQAWTIKPFIADSVDPGGVSNYALMTSKVQLDLDTVVNGGIATTGNLHAGENITVGGTVDGRDVAVDGAKLDSINVPSINADNTKLAGIEANATADQTPAEILTALKTVDTDDSGLNATTLQSVSADITQTAGTIPIRDTSGDIHARLFRSNYATQTWAPAASAQILMRNSATDDYLRPVSRDVFMQHLVPAPGAVNSTVFARSVAGANIGFGGLISGSSLRPTSAEYSAISDWSIAGFLTGGALAGTWKCTGYYDHVAGSSTVLRYGATTWVRIY